MLRVGLTGGLGSGKSTVAGMLRELGAQTIDADAVGRQLMEPGQPVHHEIVLHFGASVVRADGSLDRRLLAEMAFQHGRLRELSMIVHPAVITAQEQWMRDLAAQDPEAIAVIESALIFEADRDGTVPNWRERFDKIILVTAPHAIKVARYVARVGTADPERAAGDAEARMAAQIADEEKIVLSDIVIHNGTSLEDTRQAVRRAWEELLRANALHRQAGHRTEAHQTEERRQAYAAYEGKVS
jgi:dephospho-CoA kinase